MKIKNTILGIAAAAVIGAVTAFLFDPAKGIIRRKRMIRRGTAYADEAKERLESAADTVRSKTETMTESVEDVLAAGKKKAASIVRTKHL